LRLLTFIYILLIPFFGVSSVVSLISALSKANLRRFVFVMFLFSLCIKMNLCLFVDYYYYFNIFSSIFFSLESFASLADLCSRVSPQLLPSFLVLDIEIS